MRKANYICVCFPETCLLVGKSRLEYDSNSKSVSINRVYCLDKLMVSDMVNIFWFIIPGGLDDEKTFVNGSKQVQNMCPMDASLLSARSDLRTIVGRCHFTLTLLLCQHTECLVPLHF